MLSDEELEDYRNGTLNRMPLPAQSGTVDTTRMSGKTASKQQEEVMKPVTEHPLSKHVMEASLKATNDAHREEEKDDHI